MLIPCRPPPSLTGGGLLHSEAVPDSFVGLAVGVESPGLLVEISIGFLRKRCSDEEVSSPWKGGRGLKAVWG